MQNKPKSINVFYHRKDLDGISSLFMVQNFFDKIENHIPIYCIPYDYSDAENFNWAIMNGNLNIFVDVTPPMEVLLTIDDVKHPNTKFFIIDHHATFYTEFIKHRSLLIANLDWTYYYNPYYCATKMLHNIMAETDYVKNITPSSIVLDSKHTEVLVNETVFALFHKTLVEYGAIEKTEETEENTVSEPDTNICGMSDIQLQQYVDLVDEYDTWKWYDKSDESNHNWSALILNNHFYRILNKFQDAHKFDLDVDGLNEIHKKDILILQKSYDLYSINNCLYAITTICSGIASIAGQNKSSSISDILLFHSNYIIDTEIIENKLKNPISLGKLHNFIDDGSADSSTGYDGPYNVCVVCLRENEALDFYLTESLLKHYKKENIFVDFVIAFKQTTENLIFNVSMRQLHNKKVDLGLLCKTYFNGGGHFAAAGGKINFKNIPTNYPIS